MKISNIHTDRLTLKEVKQADIENIYCGLSHPQVIKHYGVSYSSLEATQEQMDWYGQDQQAWWSITKISDGIFCGAAGFNDISKEHKKAEIGLWLLPEYWGKGIMTEVMPAICNYAFRQMNIHRIEGFVESTNTNCKRAMSKLDFNHEGTMRDCEVKDGQYVSVDIYALIDPH